MNISRGTKTAAALCAAVLSLTTLSACGGSDGEATADGADSGCTPQVADITTVNQGKLTVGVIDQPPYSSYNGGTPEGLDIDIVTKIAEDNCLDLQWEQATFADAMQSISSGIVDIATGDINVTEKRMQVVDFPSSAYLEGVGFASKKDLDIQTVDDLETKGVESIGIGDGYGWLDDMKKVFGDKVKTYPSSVELKEDLEAGRLDVIMEAYGTCVEEFKDSDDYSIVLANEHPDERIGSLVQPPEVSYPYTKGNTALGEALSKGVEAQRDDGTIVKLLKNYGLSEGLADVGEKQYVVPLD